jgi:hypothetical protein
VRAVLTADRVRTVLIVVCVLHAVSPLILRGLHPGYGWDETVYIRQIDPHSPTGVFTAPRARGLTLLTAPASLISGSETVMRLWLALLSGVGLYLAFLPWLRLRRSFVIPAAAALWSGLWVGIYYSYEAMPNQYVAYGALAASGWMLLAVQRPDRRRHIWYAGLALALTALIRPSDSLFLLVPLVVAALLLRGPTRRQRGVIVTVLVLGLAVGWAEWIIEAYVSYGGPIARFRAASAENTGGLHWALGDQFRTLAGPILCRRGCRPHSPLTTQLWWFALPPLVGLGWFAGRGIGWLRAHVVVTAAALAIAAQYLIAIDYSAPRFLEPSYALLALPVAEGLGWIVTTLLARRAVVRRIGWRPLWPAVAVGAVAAVLAGNEVVQAHVVHSLNVMREHSSTQMAAVADYVNDHGVDGHCLVQGHEAGPISFLAHCPDAPNTAAGVDRLARDGGEDIALVSVGPVPTEVRRDPRLGWQEYSFRPPYAKGMWHAWLHLPGHAERSVLHHQV